MSPITYKSGYKYQLLTSHTVQTGIYPYEDIETDFILLTTSGMLTVKKAYAWNGVNGWWDRTILLRGSLIHDALYQLISLQLLPQHYKDLADLELIKIFKQDGASWIFAETAYWVLKCFGIVPKDNPPKIAP